MFGESKKRPNIAKHVKPPDKNTEELSCVSVYAVSPVKKHDIQRYLCSLRAA